MGDFTGEGVLRGVAGTGTICSIPDFLCNISFFCCLGTGGRIYILFFLWPMASYPCRRVVAKFLTRLENGQYHSDGYGTDWHADDGLAGRWHDSHDCIAGRKYDPAGSVLRHDLCAELLYFLSHRDGIWHGRYHGGHLYVCSQFPGSQSGMDRGRHHERGFFWRPLSTSALLVAAVTNTDFFHNLVLMARRAIIPFVLSCVIYGLAGWHSGSSAGMGLDVWHLFSSSFQLHWLTLIPAILIIVCSLLRMDVRKTMGLSIFVAFVLTVTLQHMAVADLLPMLLTGYRCPEPALAALLDGGGVLSMLPSIAIIGLSATYAGLFERTGLLLGIRHGVMVLKKWLNPFGCIWIVSFFISMVSCAQTLAVILTEQICQDLVQDKEDMMLALEDTVIVSAALIPWCIAAAVPLAAVSAPVSSLAAAVYLYLQPLWSWRQWK